MKKLISLVLCLVMALSMMSFAVAENEVPNIANTYFSYGYDIDFWMDYFFHFYDEVPGMGKVFYAGFCLNQITYAGTYEVLPEPREYACWPDRATQEAAGDADVPTGTAPYTIVFYDFDGNEIDRCGMDAEHIYVDMANLNGMGCEHNVLTLDTDPANSAFTNDYNNEQAVVLLSLVDPEDDTATLELKINGKYSDLVVLFVEGTYAMNADQTEITLTPDSADDQGAVVVKNEDGTYTYTSTDGTEATLVEVGGVEVAYTFKGQIGVPGMDGMFADFVMNLLTDGNVEIYADFMGNRMDVDAGTYEIDMTTYTITVHFETAGDIATYMNETGMNLDYVQAGNGIFGDIAQTLTLN